MTEKKDKLGGKTVVIVGDKRRTDVYADEIRRNGGTVEYPESNIGAEQLMQDQADAIGREILAMDTKPDVVMVHHPRMDMHELQGWGNDFSTNPVLQLARTLKAEGIPTLIVDSYRKGIGETQKAALRGAGATFHDMMDVFYDESVRVLAYMANNKAKLTGFGQSVGG